MKPNNPLEILLANKTTKQGEIEKAQQELAGIESEISKFHADPERIREFADRWDGNETITGRPIYVDRYGGVILLRTEVNNYFLIDVTNLRALNEYAALKIAELMGSPDYPRGNRSHGTWTFHPSGLISEDVFGTYLGEDKRQHHNISDIRTFA